MASGSNTKLQPQVPSATKIHGPILKEGRTYVPEQRTSIWFSQILFVVHISHLKK